MTIQKEKKNLTKKVTKKSPYLKTYEPIMVHKGYDEVPLVPEYILNRMTWAGDSMGMVFCYILKVADADKFGIPRPLITITNKEGEFGIYEAPTLLSIGGHDLLEKIETGDLEAHYAYNDLHPEKTYSGNECSLIVCKNKDDEDVIVAMNDEMSDLMTDEVYNKRDWRNWKIPF